QAEARRQILALRFTAPVLVHRDRTKGIVELARAPGAGMQGPRDELPERLEVLELRLVRIVMMRGGVVHVGGEPDDVANTGTLDRRKEIGDLVLAPVGRPITERDRVEADQADRQIGRDHLPGRTRSGELALQPGELLGTQNPAAVIVAL